MRGRRLLWGGAIVGFWVLVLSGAILIGGGIWIRRRFGVISVDQMLFNLQGGGGDGAGGDGIVWSLIVSAFLIPAGIVLVLALLAERSRRDLRASGVLGGRRRWILCVIAIVTAIAVPLGGAGYFGATIGVREYVESYVRDVTLGSALADYYVVPEVDGGNGTGASAGNGPGASPRNLIVIYLESIENTFADDATFERNMLAPLQSSTRGWETIPSLRQYEGGGWTMSGIVATQCGIPLRSAGNLADPTALNLIGAEGQASVEAYLPGATCLGDVLSEAGYRNVFMGGALASFAGKGTFFETHGYDEVLDLQHWLDAGETETRDWGLSDRRLFQLARSEVKQLHDAGEPFNLTMLTLDTHDPEYLYPYCEQTTETAMTSITECSMRQVADFVDYLDAAGVLEDTAVVLMGDHQKFEAPANAFWNELKDRSGRTIFNRVRVPGGVPFARDDVDQFAMYPTMLELAGFDLAGHRAGIGVSALASSAEVPPGSVLDLTAEQYSEVVTSRSSAFYERLWAGA